MENLVLDQAILDIIKQGPISEYEIITKFKSAPYHLFNHEVMSNNLALFQTHFVIFNALYRLRDLGLQHNQYDIDIISSQITYIPLTPTLTSSESNQQQSNPIQLSQNQQAIEKLRAYYLDWRNFEKTDESNVNDLIDSFWKTMFSQSTMQMSESNLEKSLSILELDNLPTKADLKRQYLTLSNTHHPDKGGCTTKFQRLNLAYSYVKKHI